MKARLLQPDGKYRRTRPARGEKLRRSQTEFMALANGAEQTQTKRAPRKSRYPQVKLASRPAFARERKP
jgi:hypothetical protein